MELFTEAEWDMILNGLERLYDSAHEYDAAYQATLQSAEIKARRLLRDGAVGELRIGAAQLRMGAVVNRMQPRPGPGPRAKDKD